MSAPAQDGFSEDALAAAVEALRTGRLTPFSRTKEADLPRVSVGLYSIWRGAEFVYVGMAGRFSRDGLAKPTALKGLADRLQSHASGRRSGDQFCVYVSDRLVIQGLSREQLHAIAEARLSLDAVVKSYIHENLAFRVHVMRGDSEADLRTATALERHFRAGATPLGFPLLNAMRGD
jgi:hypothetical protein